ncbi:MAG: nucleic acid/nucleotide deaminase domain-containing protein [Acidobacteriaceae bacterium]
MAKRPGSRPEGFQCDLRLPIAALAYRQENPELMTETGFGRINVTAWLYRNERGEEGIRVNPNITMAAIRKEFGRAPTRDAETGLHSEGIAAQFFKENPSFRVLAIFSERVPCRMQCAPLLRNYFPGVPWFYYYDRNSWRGDDGRLLKKAAAALRVAYELPRFG